MSDEVFGAQRPKAAARKARSEKQKKENGNKMNVQLKTFSIPACGSEMMEEYINKFLRSKRVLDIEKHFSPESGGYWTFCIEYMDAESNTGAQQNSKPQKDPTEGLSDVQKQRYERYREIRKDLAKQFNVPHYLVFNNEELAAIAQLDHVGPETQKIDGVAPQRLKDYLQYFYTKDEPKDATATMQPNGEDMPF